MSTTLTITTWLPVRPETLYRIWMTSRTHSEFTGSPAEIDDRVGGDFSCWNGYVFGKNLALDPGCRIVQSWRSTDFPSGAPDSELEILLDEYTGGTVLTLIHRSLPPDQAEDYRLGWEEHYLLPLKDYLERKVDGEDMH